MFPRRNWDSPNPSLASECAPPPGTTGEGAHSPAGEGVGRVSIPTTGEKLGTLPILCGPHRGFQREGFVGGRGVLWGGGIVGGSACLPVS
jgi:hypothetical protein